MINEINFNGINNIGISEITDRLDRLDRLEKIDLSPNFEGLEKTKNSGAFKSIYDSFLDMIEKTAESQTQAADLAVSFASGETDDILAVILAQEKAYAALNFANSLSNKLIASYREILAIQL